MAFWKESDDELSLVEEDEPCMEKDGEEEHLNGRKAMEAEERKSLLARKEQKAVSCLRIAVYLVVIVTAIVVSLGVYSYTKNEEEENFRLVFETNANKLAGKASDSLFNVPRRIQC